MVIVRRANAILPPLTPSSPPNFCNCPLPLKTSPGLVSVFSESRHKRGQYYDEPKRHNLEQIINKLPFGFAQGGAPTRPQQTEVGLVKRAMVAQACKKIGVADRTYYQWQAK